VANASLSKLVLLKQKIGLSLRNLLN